MTWRMRLKSPAWVCVAFACLLVAIPPPENGVEVLWRLSALGILVLLTLIHPALTIGVMAPIALSTALTFNPFWHPTVQLEVINRTDRALIVDGTTLRLAQPDPASEGMISSEPQWSAVWLEPRKSTEFDRDSEYIFQIWLKRWERSVRVRYVKLPDGGEVVVRVPMKYDDAYEPCRIVVTLYEDRADASGCQLPREYLEVFKEPPRRPYE